jgi:hypothetical protein
VPLSGLERAWGGKRIPVQREVSTAQRSTTQHDTARHSTA